MRYDLETTFTIYSIILAVPVVLQLFAFMLMRVVRSGK